MNLTRRRGDAERRTQRKTEESQHLGTRRKRRDVGWRHTSLRASWRVFRSASGSVPVLAGSDGREIFRQKVAESGHVGANSRGSDRSPDREKLRINTRNRPSRCVGGCAGIRWARRTRPRASGEASIEAFFPFFAHFDFFSASEGGVASTPPAVLRYPRRDSRTSSSRAGIPGSRCRWGRYVVWRRSTPPVP